MLAYTRRKIHFFVSNVMNVHLGCKKIKPVHLKTKRKESNFSASVQLHAGPIDANMLAIKPETAGISFSAQMS